MQHICKGCGNEVPEDNEFCYHCGSYNTFVIQFDERGKAIVSDSACATCGQTADPSDVFCQNCGTRLNSAELRVQPKMVKYGWIGLILALIPGFFNLFGLGHLFFKKWSKGFMYISLSIILYYLKIQDLSESMEWFVLIGSMVIFFLQAMDIFAIVYAPPQKKSEE